MADESMVRNLAAQAVAIWPQEEPLFRRYELPGDMRVLDAGCGTGEISSRLALLFPRASILGVDIVEGHLESARRQHAHIGERLRFENRNVFDLGLPDRSFDLVVCRHVIQAIPHPEHVIRELARVTRPGGRLHLIAEDYGMLKFPKRSLDPEDFWHDGPRGFGSATGTDLHVGRRAYSLLRAAGLCDITVDYVIVDTLRVPREVFAAILEAWRDGYAAAVAQHTRFSHEEVVAHFNGMVATIRDRDGYAVWFVPVVSGVIPPA